MIRFRFYAIRSRQTAKLSTSLGRVSHGLVETTRWEFGVGKGGWKRRLRKLDERVEVKTLWLGPWARYTLRFESTRANADLLWERL